MSSPMPRVSEFGDIPHPDPSLLGGKGASLVRMRSLGLPVPPGFVVTTDVCRAYQDHPEVLDDVWPEVVAALGQLGGTLNRHFADPSTPLLVSVRSGAAVSMPGMMDTILDLGLCDRTMPGLAGFAGEAFARETYARLVRMYGTIVEGIGGAEFESARLASRSGSAGELADIYQSVFESAVGRAFPQDPWLQLRGAVEAVLRSWNSPRARKYRDFASLDHGLGTAVIVQAMVFGNMDQHSGTGVAFTRDPATGAKGVYGDFLLRAQGEDVVAGEHDPADIATLAELIPAAYDLLVEAVPRLEAAYADMCDIEFTVEKGRFWLLQARKGQRTAIASIRIALELVDEGVITLEEAMHRIAPVAMMRIGDPLIASDSPRILLGRGLNASPGAAVGRLALTSAQAEEWAASGEAVILARPFTSPDDIGGFIASRGVLTAHGGRTSHAAVVARGMDLPAVCGIKGLRFEDGCCEFPGGVVVEGDLVSMDGAAGEIYRGAMPLVQPGVDTRVERLLALCDERRALPILVQGDVPSWADRSWDPVGVHAVCEVAELDDVLDDVGSARILVDPAASGDPRALLRAIQSLPPSTEEVYLRVGADWPAALRSVPAEPWAGIVAEPASASAARLIAAVLDGGSH